ncbi:MAG: hypothetical protein HQM09_23170 [Candidatus Riflebacteria bacterium]|nr:hypothetical protein [Candidatus Riflebacteria bacterium]
MIHIVPTQVRTLLMLHNELYRHLDSNPSSRKSGVTLDFLCLALCHQHSALNAAIVVGEIHGGHGKYRFPVLFMERNDNIISMLEEPLTPASVAALKAEIEEARKSWEAWIAEDAQNIGGEPIGQNIYPDDSIIAVKQ